MSSFSFFNHFLYFHLNLTHPVNYVLVIFLQFVFFNLINTVRLRAIDMGKVATIFFKINIIRIEL